MKLLKKELSDEVYWQVSDEVSWQVRSQLSDQIWDDVDGTGA